LRLVVLIKRISILQWLSPVVQRSNIVRIDNRLPLAIQANGPTRIDIRDQRGNLRRASAGEELQAQNKSQTTEEIRHERVSVSILKALSESNCEFAIELGRTRIRNQISRRTEAGAEDSQSLAGPASYVAGATGQKLTLPPN
jgi:hypothetical protein